MAKQQGEREPILLRQGVLKGKIPKSTETPTQKDVIGKLGDSETNATLLTKQMGSEGPFETTKTAGAMEDLNAPEETTGEIVANNLKMIEELAKNFDLKAALLAVKDTREQITKSTDEKLIAELSENLKIYKARTLELWEEEKRKILDKMAGVLDGLSSESLSDIGEQLEEIDKKIKEMKAPEPQLDDQKKETGAKKNAILKKFVEITNRQEIQSFIKTLKTELEKEGPPTNEMVSVLVGIIKRDGDIPDDLLNQKMKELIEMTIKKANGQVELLNKLTQLKLKIETVAANTILQDAESPEQETATLSDTSPEPISEKPTPASETNTPDTTETAPQEGPQLESGAQAPVLKTETLQQSIQETRDALEAESDPEKQKQLGDILSNLTEQARKIAESNIQTEDWNEAPGQTTPAFAKVAPNIETAISAPITSDTVVAETSNTPKPKDPEESTPAVIIASLTPTTETLSDSSEIPAQTTGAATEPTKTEFQVLDLPEIKDATYDSRGWDGPDTSTPPEGTPNPLLKNVGVEAKPIVEKSTGLLRTIKRWGQRLGLAGLLMGAQPSDVTPHHALDETMREKIEFLNPSGVDLDADADSNSREAVGSDTSSTGQGPDLEDRTPSVSPESSTETAPITTKTENSDKEWWNRGEVRHDPGHNSITRIVAEHFKANPTVFNFSSKNISDAEAVKFARLVAIDNNLINIGLGEKALGMFIDVRMTQDNKPIIVLYDKKHQKITLAKALKTGLVYDLSAQNQKIAPETTTTPTAESEPNGSSAEKTLEQAEAGSAVTAKFNPNLEVPEAFNLPFGERADAVAVIEINDDSAAAQSAKSFQAKIAKLPYPSQQLVEVFKNFVLDLRSQDKERLRHGLAVLNNQYEVDLQFPELQIKKEQLNLKIAKLGDKVPDDTKQKYANAVFYTQRLDTMIKDGKAQSLNQIKTAARKAQDAIAVALITINT